MNWLKRSFGRKAKQVPPAEGVTVAYPVDLFDRGGHAAGVYIGDGIYLRGADEPHTYPLSVHIGGVQH